jgi:hypothetical protein
MVSWFVFPFPRAFQFLPFRVGRGEELAGQKASARFRSVCQAEYGKNLAAASSTCMRRRVNFNVATG